MSFYISGIIVCSQADGSDALGATKARSPLVGNIPLVSVIEAWSA